MRKRNNVFLIVLIGFICLGIAFFSFRPAKGATKLIYKISIETVVEEGVTDGMIDRGLVPYVQRVLQEAEMADAVILEINTHGGRVDSAVKILDDIRDANVRTIAFIRRAISAGALVSLATDDIVMTPGATIGAATPITISPTGEADPVGEKYVSYLRAEFRAAATSKGRRSDIAEAMVDANVEIQDPSFKLTAESLENLEKDLKKEEVDEEAIEDVLYGLEKLEDEDFLEKDEFLEAVEQEIGEEYLKEYKDLILKHARSLISQEGKLLTLTAEEALGYKVRIAEYQASNIREALKMVATRIILTKQTLEDLQENDVPDEIIESLRPLVDEEFTRKTEFVNAVEKEIKQSQLGKYERLIWKYVEKEFDFQDVSPDQIQSFELNWAEQLVRFLTSPVVSSLLMTFGFLGLFFEFRTPGFGVFGAIGLVCLGLFFWGHFLVRLAGWEELLLFIIGIILLAIEIFVIPGFGVVGILGLVAIVTSLALATVGRIELVTFPDVSAALTKVTVALILSIIVAIVLAKFLPRTSLGRHIILSTTQEHDAGFVAQSTEQHELLGAIGVTITPVHPSGTILLNDRRYGVVSEGEFIGKNVNVKVIDVEGSRIVVRQVDETAMTELSDT